MAGICTGHEDSSATEEAGEGDYVATYDGNSFVNVQLDSAGSVIWYLPALGQEGEEGDDVALRWFQEIEATLQRVHLEAPKPPKDTSGESDRAQYYAVGSYAVHPVAAAPCGSAPADLDTQGEAQPAVSPPSWHFRANPRWCQGARPLAGADLACILRVKALVEAAVQQLLGPEGGRRPPHGGAAGEPLFNSVLVNRYADGRSQIRWHADDENCYGPPSESVIASVSLGAARGFELRRRPRRGDRGRSAQRRRRLLLRSGSLLVMAGSTQAEWQHSVPADLTCTGPRINLTFRRIFGERRRGEEPPPH